MQTQITFLARVLVTDDNGDEDKLSDEDKYDKVAFILSINKPVNALYLYICNSEREQKDAQGITCSQLTRSTRDCGEGRDPHSQGHLM